ncbi:hypothetical protein HPB48_026411 [Haemaphysalis longicornis]|uniref:Peptidyl-prolyl cis-trans isomerase n=1 Tax=Haemaphysalis longicornis TaxID=44386 RepID=A0A9J6HAP7_HAELO|nr:hypothetical protein HPB48_026411 [Haemaphysalis longicornis]
MITLSENLDYLDGQHCVFGYVAEGLETVERLNTAVCDGEGRPYQDVRICHTVVLHDPFDDPPNLELPDASPEPTLEMLQSDRIGAHEVVDDMQGRSMEEVEEEIQNKEAKARATVLEMIGDLPDVDAAPPENVLFVCKLNPVTTDEDLEIIFSRFGPVKSCEVIRDKKTGDSLQYAFVEFEQREHCENAYFKMDNVLIDDRRIHVDFSQSVAKLRWKGKGRGVEHIDEEPASKKPRGPRYELKETARRDASGGQFDLVWSDDEEGDKKQKERDGRGHKSSRSDRDGRDRDSRRDRHGDGHRSSHRDDGRRSHRDEHREKDRERHHRDEDRDRHRRDEKREKDRDRDQDSKHGHSRDDQSSSSYHRSSQSRRTHRDR